MDSHKTLISGIFFQDKSFEEEYINCIFEDCDMSGMRIERTCFENCSFVRCNFSLSKMFSNLAHVSFHECKMTGADLTGLSKYSNTLQFEKSILDYVSFVGVKLQKTIFRDCQMHEAYFDSADMQGSKFINCDLMNSSFHNTNLEKADFSTSHNYTINPNFNRLKKAVFSPADLRGLVAHLGIVLKDD